MVNAIASNERFGRWPSGPEPVTPCLIDAATLELRASGTAVAAAIAIVPFTKTLQNYSMYEQRRRRAADAIELKLMALLDARSEKIQEELPNAAKVSKLHKARGKSFDPSDFGFFRKHFAPSFSFNELQGSIRLGEFDAGTSGFHFRG